MSDKIIKGLWLSLGGACLILFVLYLRQAAISLNQPYPWEYGEGWNLLTANWIDSGGISHMYPTASQSPYYQGMYPPLYFVIVGTLFKLFGASLFWGRLVTFIFGLASGVVAYFIVKEVTKSRLLGFVGGVIFFLPPIMRAWSLFFKTNSMALFLSLLGMYVAIRFIGTKKVLWSVPIFILLVFTKQTFLAAPIAVGIYLLITNRKLMLWYAGLLLVGGLALTGVFQILTHGSFVNSIMGNPTALPVYIELAIYLIRNTVIYHWIILLMACSAVMLVLVTPKDWRGAPTLLVLYFLMASAMFVITTGKAGTWYDYSLEFLAVATLLIPILILKLSKLDPVKGRIGVLVGTKSYFVSGFLLAQLLLPALLVIQIIKLPSFASWTPVNTDLKESYSIVLRDIEEIGNRDILCEDAILLYKTGRDPLYEPAYSNQAARNSGLDMGPLIENLNNKHYALIIQEWALEDYYKWPSDVGVPDWIPKDIQREYWMPWARCSDEVADAMLANYQFKRHVGRLWVYEPIS